MGTKYVIAIENGMHKTEYLVNGGIGFYGIKVPFSFKSCNIACNEVVTFNTKEEAISTYEDTIKQYTGYSRPYLIEVIENTH